MDPKIPCIFGHFGKFTTRHKFINILSTFWSKTVIFITFLVFLQILLQNYGTNQCLVMHWLKHKCMVRGYQGTHTIFSEGLALRRQCEIKDIKFYQVRTKIIAPGWYWVTMILFGQINPKIHNSPAMHNVQDKTINLFL